jgi:putative holliday junction resolvase
LIINVLQKSLGIDFGHARIGLAISDTYNHFAIPYKLIRHKNIQNTLDELLLILQKEQIEIIIFGYPLDLDGMKTPMCASIDMFAKNLQVFLSKKGINIKMIFWNETLTSVEATENLLLKKKTFSEKDGTIDIESARIILQEYLNNIETL